MGIHARLSSNELSLRETELDTLLQEALQERASRDPKVLDTFVQKFCDSIGMDNLRRLPEVVPEKMGLGNTDGITYPD